MKKEPNRIKKSRFEFAGQRSNYGKAILEPAGLQKKKPQNVIKYYYPLI